MDLAQRRFDIDWLRVIAIGLLLIYHISIGFQPWGVFIRFIQSSESLEWIWVPMAMLNVWRIPLLFFVSGMGVFFAIQRRDWKRLIAERSRRILLPFIFGVLIIVPLHVYLWQSYYQQDLEYMPNPAHLWFLGNIFIYVIIFSPLFFYLKKHRESKIHRVLIQIFKTPLGLIPIMLLFLVEVIVVQPENFELYAMTFHGFWLGMIAFVCGFLCVYSGQTFWPMIDKWKWLLLLFATGLYLIRILYYDFKSPDYLLVAESILWVFGVMALGQRYLNKPSKTLSYLSEAAYPVYIIHMAFLYLGSLLIFDLNINIMLKFIIINIFTFGGCMLTYELVIRRIGFLRPLFGLKVSHEKG